MHVLVAYASRHGSTKGIAERIGQRLGAAGLQVDVVPAGEVRRPDSYDALVVGGAAYMFRWLGEASAFVRRNRRLLAARPTWLFSSGPLGPEVPDKNGRMPRDTCVPREWAELLPEVRPRDTYIFFGAWDPSAKPIGVAERFMRLMPGANAAMPSGDFRDWPEIDAWADAIAAELVAAGSAREGAVPAGTSGAR